MDFVISKVAMSVCALLVVAVLGGLMDPSGMAEEGHALDALVRTFCGLVDRLAFSGSDGTLCWTVPYLSDGQQVRFVVKDGLVMVEASGERSVGEPVAGIHTWQDTGLAMNSTGLRFMDSLAPALTAVSGERIILLTELVLLDNEPARLVFARPDA